MSVLSYAKSLYQHEHHKRLNTLAKKQINTCALAFLLDVFCGNAMNFLAAIPAISVLRVALRVILFCVSVSCEAAFSFTFGRGTFFTVRNLNSIIYEPSNVPSLPRLVRWWLESVDWRRWQHCFLWRALKLDPRSPVYEQVHGHASSVVWLNYYSVPQAFHCVFALRRRRHNPM